MWLSKLIIIITVINIINLYFVSLKVGQIANILYWNQFFQMSSWTFASFSQLDNFEGDKLLSLQQQCSLPHDINLRQSMIRVLVLGAIWRRERSFLQFTRRFLNTVCLVVFLALQSIVVVFLQRALASSFSRFLDHKKTTRHSR